MNPIFGELGQTADCGYVLETGKVVLEGDGEELLVDDDVKWAYFDKDCGDFYDGKDV